MVNKISDYVPITFIDESKIPKGMYCYTAHEWTGIKLKITRCPYWRTDETRHHQQNGYCIAFNFTDWDEDAGGFGLLWDQIKVCDRGDPDDWEVGECNIL